MTTNEQAHAGEDYEIIDDDHEIQMNTDGINTTPNAVYGISVTDGIKTTPNEVYAVTAPGFIC